MVQHNFKIVNADTDSIMFSKLDGAPFSEEEQENLLNELNSLFPPTIKFEHDGLYTKVIVVKSKNYVLQQGLKYKLKGSSLIDSKKEPALSEMLNEMIDILLFEDGRSLEQTYINYVHEAMNIKDIKRWCVKKTVTKAVLNGDDEESRLNESKVLDAMNMAISKGLTESYQEGDRVYLFNALDGQIQAKAKGEPVFYKDGRPKMIDNEILMVRELWTPGAEHKMHYVKRCYQTIKILENVIPMQNFKDYTKKLYKDELEGLTSVQK